MDDFFKQFRAHLEQRPEPAFEVQDWQDLQKRLDSQGKKRLAGFAWWWLALPFLLLLLGLNGAFFYALQQSNRKIALLENQRDTIYKTQVIYQTDTIYKTITIHEVVGEYQTLRVAQAPPIFSEQKLIENGGMNTDSVFHSNLPSTNAPEKPNFIGQLEWIHAEKINTFSPNPILIPAPILKVNEPIAEKSKKTLAQHLYPMLPKGFQLGVNGGGAFPFNDDVTQVAGFSMGAQGLIEFSPNLQLWADASYQKTRFETNRMDAALGVPIVEPPADNFIFSTADVPQPSLQFSLGMQYFLNSRNKFQPFIGAGLGTVSLLPHEIIYEFRNDALGVEWSFEKAMPRSEALTNFWVIRAGLDYKISKHLHWQFISSYRGNWRAVDSQFLQMLGLQTGFNYRFKKN
ncbi:MAG: outer membrane beta-barrel protein [Saprospiraceae bacterium]|nr:outer membrane beta-barrel protein [Saprospiraceae bacterium]